MYRCYSLIQLFNKNITQKWFTVKIFPILRANTNVYLKAFLIDTSFWKPWWKKTKDATLRSLCQWLAKLTKKQLVKAWNFFGCLQQTAFLYSFEETSGLCCSSFFQGLEKYITLYMIEEVRRTFKSQTYTECIESNILFFSPISLRRQPFFYFAQCLRLIWMEVWVKNECGWM